MTIPIAMGGAGGVHYWDKSNLPGVIAAYDFSDLSTLFQDTAGTTPVTGASQNVRYVKDLSGYGRDLVWQGGSPIPQSRSDGSRIYVDVDGQTTTPTGDFAFECDFGEGDITTSYPAIYFMGTLDDKTSAGGPGIMEMLDTTMGSGGDWFRIAGRNDSGLNLQVDGLSWADDSTITLDLKQLFEARWNGGTTARFYMDTVEIENDTSVTATGIDWGGIRVGAEQTDQTNACRFYWWDLVIHGGSVITDNSDTEDYIFAYFNDKHGKSYT